MINSVVLVGRLTFNPEIKSSATGKSVTRFQVAVDRQYTPKGQEKQADFIDCIAWEKTADFVGKYFVKGSWIALTGSIQTSNFTDNSGNKRKSVEINVSNVSFCGNKENANKSDLNADLSVSVDESKFEELKDDELPF